MSQNIIQKQRKNDKNNQAATLQNQLENDEKQEMTLEKLITKHSQSIYEMIGKKAKNALDFEWITIQTHESCIKYNIEMHDKKKFDYNPETREIIWYKNLNIPAIRVTKKQEQKPQNEAKILEVNSKIMALRGVKERNFQQIGLFGELQKRFDKDICVFNHLRFKETYFQYKRSYFSLVVVIYEKCEDKNIISEIKISSPIRVEARKKSYQDRLNNSSLLDPFLPDFIEKQQTIFKQGAKDVIPIRENLEGLLDYLKAQNIRHKVFHPFFFLIKFFSATELYYNTNIIKHQQDIQPQDLFKLIQREIYKCQIIGQDSSSRPLENKLLIICLNNQGKDNHKNKICEKISKFLKCLENTVLYYSEIKINGLPKQFKQISFSREELKDGYIKAYNNLSSLKFEMAISKQKNTQSHISIQKKGQIPKDLKLDKESFEYLNNIPGPFHKAIFDLTIRNQQLYLNADRIKARFEDFNLFTYDIHEDPQNEMFGPSLINEIPFKRSRNYQELQKIIEKKKQPKHIPGSVSGTTKPSSSDSNNGKGNSQSAGCEIENSDYNNNTCYSYSNSSLNDRSYKQKNNIEKDREEIIEKNSQISKEYREGEEYSSSSKEMTYSQNNSNKKYKNHKMITKNSQKQHFKKMCTDNSKIYLNNQKQNVYKTDEDGQKNDEEENEELDEEDNDDEYNMQEEDENLEEQEDNSKNSNQQNQNKKLQQERENFQNQMNYNDNNLNNKKNQQSNLI